MNAEVNEIYHILMIGAKKIENNKKKINLP